MSNSATPKWSMARSFLFVPGDRPERYVKALASGADAIIIDLEDAVSMSAKVLARTALGDTLPTLNVHERARILVRINPQGTPWHDDDLALVGSLGQFGVAGVVVPKAQSAESVADVASACPGLGLLPLLETAEGFHAIDAVAHAPQVVRLGLGHIDLQADLEMCCAVDEQELAPARWAIVVASRRANLAPPVDGVTTSVSDPALLQAATERSRRFGFSAKLCIHPSQVAIVHTALTPAAREVDWAQRVVLAMEKSDGGAVSVDGKMVDPPVLALARQILARAKMAVARN
jgi:citrate lyase subunit beta/citryl-CoA lyase